jgi:hypothetical protein
MAPLDWLITAPPAGPRLGGRSAAEISARGSLGPAAPSDLTVHPVPRWLAGVVAAVGTTTPSVAFHHTACPDDRPLPVAVAAPN